MKNRFIINYFSVVVFSLFTITQVYAQPTPPEGMQWEVVPALTDEFNTFDTSKWWKPLWNYGEPVMMLGENSGVTDGKLWIKATLDNTSSRWFETSRVMSFAQIKFPMYMECSMKTAHISAYNTFWLNNGNIDDRDEIDMCENNSKPSVISQTSRPFTLHSQYFLVSGGEANTERAADNFDNRNLSNANPLKGVKWNEAYHTIGIWWKDKNNIQFYLNGEPAGNVVAISDFTRDLNVIWDLWTINQPWSGGIAIKNDLLDDQINTMRVDWIHTYSLVEGASLSILDNNAPVKKNSEVYPNPTTDILNIDLNSITRGITTVQIYNTTGQLVKTELLDGGINQISLIELSSGIYFVKVLNGVSFSYHSIIKE